MSAVPHALHQASVVAIDGRAVMIEGPPGSGKSTLALALIDRGAKLIGDDGVRIERHDETLMACPPPNIAGKIELRGIGIATLESAPPAPLGLILELCDHCDRLPEQLPQREILGLSIPVLPFIPGTIAPAVRAEWALAMHGLAL